MKLTTTERKHWHNGRWLNGANFHSYAWTWKDYGFICFWGSVTRVSMGSARHTYRSYLIPYIKVYKLI